MRIFWKFWEGAIGERYHNIVRAGLTLLPILENYYPEKQNQSPNVVSIKQIAYWLPYFRAISQQTDQMRDQEQRKWATPE